MTQARRVRLVLRRIEPWTVLKFSLLLYASLYLVLMVAGFALWTAASVTGLRGNVESFVGDLVASEDFRFMGGELLRASLIGGTVLVVLASGVTVLLSVLHNLISDLIGGFGVVFEERPSRHAGRRSATDPPTSRSVWQEDVSELPPPAPPKSGRPKAKKPAPRLKADVPATTGSARPAPPSAPPISPQRPAAAQPTKPTPVPLTRPAAAQPPTPVPSARPAASQPPSPRPPCQQPAPPPRSPRPPRPPCQQPAPPPRSSRAPRPRYQQPALPPPKLQRPAQRLPIPPARPLFPRR